MSDRLSRIEERLRQVDDAVACLSQRLERLERGGARSGDLAIAAPVPHTALRPPRSDAVGLLSLTGRTCLVFGGAYLLRALTESGQIPITAGVLLGLVYAVGWLAAAERAGSTSALFHGLATVLIGLPIVWEAAARFGFLSPAQSGLALAAIVALALVVAWHRRLAALAAVVVLGTLAASVALVISLDRIAPFAALLVGSAGAALWIAYHRNWTWLAVLTGLTSVVAVLAALMRTLAVPPRDPAGTVLALQIALVAIYFASFAARALFRSPLGIYEYVQGALVLVAGLGGAIALTRGNDLAVMSIGGVTLAGAALAYGIAFGAIRRQNAPAATLHFFTSLGLVLALVGGRLLLADAPYAVALSAGALAAVGLGRWTQSPALTLHGALALFVAATFSGALALIERVWFSTLTVWPTLSPSVWAVIAAALVCFVLSGGHEDDGDARLVVPVRVALAALTVAGLGTFVVIWIGPLLTGPTPVPGITATLKSLVLAISTILLAWTRSAPGLTELSRLTYPLLIAGGLKILLEDLSASRPATLFVALALYGTALILAPRVLKPRQKHSLPG
jgi:hypothetical protein